MSVSFYVMGDDDPTDEYVLISHHEVNMSNSNAYRVASTLGIDLEEGGWAGEMDARDFLGRVLLALAVEPQDSGIPAHEVPTGGPRWIDCGRREGYVQERLTNLHDLAQHAIKDGKPVLWS